MERGSVWPRVGIILIVTVAALATGILVSTGQALLRQGAVAAAMTGGDPTRAPALFRRYGCGGCHTIPGIAGADGKVGGRLDGLSQQVYIAGVVPNSADALIAWIVTPQRFSPHSAMPATGVSEDEARDLAAYLYAH
ncbi:cytochrome C [Xaviernesmea oryzae]|uniref:Cytochrome C n=1 Tax=Xaviernesmea oryzae TaxID=464029 RepID=A0A1Q9AR74_9HYPH|nr:c-type cytochrome [Xaviernesmea oryzae]OLP57933.1 cytochrome C [Xaviernesmea oryzae]SEL30207.1 Cytochrome c2 [Xaviernesmea oryzae]